MSADHWFVYDERLREVIKDVKLIRYSEYERDYFLVVTEVGLRKKCTLRGNEESYKKEYK